MKKILAALCVVAVIGCTSVKEIQVEMIKAQLIKIDTIYRQPNFVKQQLTWRGDDNIQYVSFVPIDEQYPLGVSLLVMKTR